MKRLILALGLSVGALAISTPASAQSGCRWYDVNCRLATGDGRSTGGTIDSSWHIIGRDANGNQIYERRRVDGNGNVVVERARRDNLGRMVIIDRDINNRNNQVLRSSSNRYDQNGMICKYKENEKGYQEKCKYAKNKAGKLYRVNDVYRDGVYRDGVYRTNTVNGDKYNKAVQKQSTKYNKAVEKQSKEYNKAVERQNKEYNKANKHNKN